MPISFNNLWDSFIDFENIYHAFREASKGKRYRWEAMKFSAHFEIEIITLINELVWQMYEPRPYRQFWITEPKKRLINAPAFRDRIVHWAIYLTISHIFENRFITGTFACIEKRGTHKAALKIHQYTKAMRQKWGDYYFLKCDISRYFPNIDHEILKSIIARTISDKKLLWLIKKIIQSHESTEQDGKGIPIGALTSQLFANIYLDPLDHFIKEVCREKYYIRYMDDFIILHNNRTHLFELLCKIENYLHDNLKLNLNPHTGIFPGKHGIDFCGYRIWPTHIKPRKSTVKRARKRFKKYVKTYKSDPGILKRAKASIQSFLGYMKHCSGYNTTVSIFDNTVFKTRGGQP